MKGHKWFALGRLLNMIREAFDTRKRFPGVPKILCAEWVGTILHSSLAEHVTR